jgi:ribosomal protein S27AE
MTEEEALMDIVVTEKRCPRCSFVKPVSEWGQNRARYDGLGSLCRECFNTWQRHSARKNRDKERIRQAAWRDANPEKPREITRRYRQLHPDRVAMRSPHERSVHPERVKARKALYYAVKVGTVIRSATCQQCNSSASTQGHHTDYSRPLDVRWLCPRCHKRIHMELGNHA